MKKLFLSLILLCSVSSAGLHAASVDGFLRSVGIRSDEIMNFTHKGKKYNAHIASHQGHQAIHITDAKGNEAILIRKNGEWVEYTTFGQRMGRGAKSVAKKGLIGIGVILSLGVVALGQTAYRNDFQFRNKDHFLNELEYVAVDDANLIHSFLCKIGILAGS